MSSTTVSSQTGVTDGGLIAVSWRDENWLTIAKEAMRIQGCVVVLDVMDEQLLDATRDSLRAAHEGIRNEIGDERLARAGELGVLRAPMAYDARMFDLLALEPMLAIVDATVSSAATLHLQNGFVLPSLPVEDAPANFQQSFHMDFPRYLNGYVASINTLLAIDDFTAENGATLVVPGSHQLADRPDDEYMQRFSVPVLCPAGSMIVFDSTLWHAAGKNRSGADRLGVNQQFTRSFIKQQIDYVRALGDDTVLAQPARTQQLLGWYTRVVTSLDEYYQPAERRLYRSGQG